MKFIAMYLPQFHSCPYNSEWWGDGFTEWDNVKKAKPIFPGHHQPRIPLGGYYSLDNPEAIQNQAHLASQYGIFGFSIYHYWYEGRRPLSKPIDIILNNKDIDLKFSLCWANHSWTRSWSNRTGALDVLIEQTCELDPKSRKKHEEYLCLAFSDERYIRIGDKPFFQIYAPENIPNISTFIDSLRSSAKEMLGEDIHISAVLTAWRQNREYLNLFDSATLFQPSLALFSPQNLFDNDLIKTDPRRILLLLRASPPWFKKVLYRIQDFLPETHKTFEYDFVWRKLIAQYAHCASELSKPVFPMAFVNFDNTPRYNKRAKIFAGYSSEKFQKYLFDLVGEVKKSSDDSLIFVNAWNEWGEGMYLEPDILEGYSRLEAVRFASKIANTYPL